MRGYDLAEICRRVYERIARIEEDPAVAIFRGMELGEARH